MDDSRVGRFNHLEHYLDDNIIDGKIKLGNVGKWLKVFSNYAMDLMHVPLAKDKTVHFQAFSRLRDWYRKTCIRIPD